MFIRFLILSLLVGIIAATLSKSKQELPPYAIAPKSGSTNVNDLTGVIVTSLLYYIGNEMYSLNLAAYDPPTNKYTFIQELIPSSLKLDVLTFTTFDEASRTYTVVVPNYPKTAEGTFWQSKINGGVNVSTPIQEAVTIPFPVSKSPFPLNVAHLSISRIINKNEDVFVIFSNGDVYQVDFVGKTFVFMYSLIPDSDQLDEPHMMFTAWGHLYDSYNDCVWSIAMAGSNAFLLKSSLTDKKVLQTATPMTMPSWDNPNIQGGFATESVVNMHLAQVEADKPPRIIVILMSPPNVGFDLAMWLNTETAALEDLYSFIYADILLLDENNLNACDSWRVSTFDPVSNLLFFQGHLTTMEENDAINYIGFQPNKVNGDLTFYVNTYGAWAPFGMSGFQFVHFLQ